MFFKPQPPNIGNNNNRNNHMRVVKTLAAATAIGAGKKWTEKATSSLLFLFNNLIYLTIHTTMTLYIHFDSVGLYTARGVQNNTISDATDLIFSAHRFVLSPPSLLPSLSPFSNEYQRTPALHLTSTYVPPSTAL